jgi:hypothetical protein
VDDALSWHADGLFQQDDNRMKEHGHEDAVKRNQARDQQDRLAFLSIAGVSFSRAAISALTSTSRTTKKCGMLVEHRHHPAEHAIMVRFRVRR